MTAARSTCARTSLKTTIDSRSSPATDGARRPEWRRLDHVADRDARLAAVAEDFLDATRLVVEAEDHFIDLRHLLEEIELIVEKGPIEDRHDRFRCVNRKRA
jgi:hypothetical protein